MQRAIIWGSGQCQQVSDSFQCQERRGIELDTAEEREFLPVVGPSWLSTKKGVIDKQEGQRAVLIESVQA